MSRNINMRPRMRPLLGPRFLVYLGGLAGLIWASIILSNAGLDIWLASLFHTPKAAMPWSHEYRPLYQFIYKYGTIPAALLALGCATGLLLTIGLPRLRLWRRRMLCVVLAVVLGPWLLCNVIFKDNWGRPRPKQIIAFGGQYPYKSVWERGPKGQGTSFPSGHAAMGFALAYAALLIRRRRALRYALLGGGAGLGAMVGLVRMIQGAHFASDVVWSAGITLGVGLILYDLVIRVPRAERFLERDPPWWVTGPWVSPDRTRLGLGLGAAAGLLALAVTVFLITRPIEIVTRYWYPYRPGLERAVVRVEADRARVRLAYKRQKWAVDIRAKVDGFGLPWHRIIDRGVATPIDRGVRMSYRRRTGGVFVDMAVTVDVYVHPDVKAEVVIITRNGPVTIKPAKSPPAPLGPVVIQTDSGRINLDLPPGLKIEGNWIITSRRGGLRVNLIDPDPIGLTVWRLKTGSGNLRLRLKRHRAMSGPAKTVNLKTGWLNLKLKIKGLALTPGSLALIAGSDRGDIDFEGRFNPKAGSAVVLARSISGRVFLKTSPGFITRPGDMVQLNSARPNGVLVDLISRRGDVRVNLISP